MCALDILLRHTGTSLNGPFSEAFDKLSSNSQQAFQQLVTQGSKLVPEGSSVRDSFDKLSLSSQQALFHLANSGLSFPSLIHGQTAPSTASEDVSKADKAKIAQLGIEVSSAKKALQSAKNEAQAAYKQNDALSDLLKHSQADLTASQAHTHELLASVATLEDVRVRLEADRFSLAEKTSALEDALSRSRAASQQGQHCPPCSRSEEAQCSSDLYGFFGSQVCTSSLPLVTTSLLHQCKWC